MKGHSFRDIIAWQKAHSLCVDIYKILASNKDFSYRDQIQRAAVSIMNNIAEGHSRRSDKSFRNLLLIAKGSAAEVESMLELGKSLGYFTSIQHEDLTQRVDEISRLITGLVKFLETRQP
ncbi:MAG: four helix bundle protein [Patescibacteria group bacterium]